MKNKGLNFRGCVEDCEQELLVKEEDDCFVRTVFFTLFAGVFLVTLAVLFILSLY